MAIANEKSASTSGNVCSDVDNARKPLARLRCLKECMDSLRENRPLPNALCYVPGEVKYELTKNEKVAIYSSTAKDRVKLTEVFCTPANAIIVSGEDLYTSEGHWGRVLKILNGDNEVSDAKVANGWILLCSKDQSVVEYLKPAELSGHGTNAKESVSDAKSPPFLVRWEDVVEHEYALRLSKLCETLPPDEAAVDRMHTVPLGWTLQHYEQLARLLMTFGGEQIDSPSSLGDIREYVESIEVSSHSDDDGADHLTDSNAETYWETDGGMGSHWIRLKMKSGTIIRKLMLCVNSSDDNYVPNRIVVMAGESASNLHKVNDVTIDHSVEGLHDIDILTDQTEHFPCIEIRIKECQDGGIDARIRGIKIKSSKEKEMGLNRDLLDNKELLIRYPLLGNYDLDVLYRRALTLLRLMRLVDSVLPFIVPQWEYSLSSHASVEIIRELLPLSKKRAQLIDQFLRESESTVPGSTRKVYIDRRAAMEHRCDPSVDPDCRNSVFCQLFEGLKPREAGQKPLDYRWPIRNHQWWECKFIGEGMIDQGGGFRDCLSDLAEELCPSSSEGEVPIPFFIRSPNQRNDDATNFRDLYIPNPSCTQYHKYEWIGKLMGACFRGKENLVLSLPSFFWKMLCGQPVSWVHDFITVDETCVKLIESMRTMSEEGFVMFYGDILMWSTTLSNGTVVQLKPAPSAGETAPSHVTYDTRLEYAHLVEQARLNESKLQVEAIQRGLLQVIPQAALQLYTWQEVERRICGDPEITMTALKQNVLIDDMQSDDSRVKYFWEVLEKFSNEDRSRFLRFVCGRRRMPASIHVMSQEGTDVLPTASTCGSALFLPAYTSASRMEEKLRYAAYNCIAIDTDMSAHHPYDD